MAHDAATWADYAEALAFVGNSLLAPMNQTGAVGLDPEFWAGFPDFNDSRTAASITTCSSYALEAQDRMNKGEDVVQNVSVEYTKLFVGPPRPAAAPWETMYRSREGSTTVGFGQATFEMRALLREAELEVSNENNQYADHIGIELLYASVLCSKIAEAGNDHDSQDPIEVQLVDFIRDHPLAWIGKLHDAVQQVKPSGYIAALLQLGQTLLESI